MSNLMILGGGPLTMSSYEIAELLQTRHDSVKRSIERCVNRGAITPPPLVEVQNAIDASGLQIYGACMAVEAIRARGQKDGV